MNKFISTINVAFLLFVSVNLSCSDPDFEVAPSSSFNDTTKNIPKKRIPPQSQEPQPQSFLSSPQAKFAADITTTVAKTVASAGYHAGSWVISNAISAYNNRNQHPSLGDVHTLKNNSDYESDSDSEEEFEVITEERKSRFYPDPNELQSALRDSPEKAIAKLNQAIKSYYQDEDPVHHQTQLALFHMHTLLQESCNHGNELTLQPVIANNYNDTQRKILIQAVQEHVEKIEPSIEEKYSMAIKQAILDRDRKIDRATKKFEAETRQADTERQKKLTKCSNRLKHIAYNDACLAMKSNSHPAHNPHNFESIETYKNFLSEMRQKYAADSSSSQQDTPALSAQCDAIISELQENKTVEKGKTKKK